MNTTVKIDELELADGEVLYNVTCRGELFTGTAVSENEYEDERQEWRYVDGKAHGRWITESGGGQLLEECFYEHGTLTTRQEWTREGVLCLNYQREPYLEEKFYPDGTLKLQRTMEGLKKYYPNGQRLELFTYDSEDAVFYDKDGVWLFRHKKDGEKALNMRREKITFHEEAMRGRYLELLGEEELYGLFHEYIALWLAGVASKERAEYVCAMIASENLWIKAEGISLAERHRVMEALDLLEKERNNKTMLPRLRMFEGGETLSFKDISQLARPAIGSLKNGESWKRLSAMLPKQAPAREQAPTFDAELFKRVAKSKPPVFEGGVEEPVIRKWEKKLGLQFPKSYVEFLKRFGDGCLAGAPYILGISDEEYSAVYRHLDEYRGVYGVPERFLVVSEYSKTHRMSHLLCLDLGRMADGDCPVVSCIYQDYELTAVEDYAANFWEAFNMLYERLLKKIIESGEEEEEEQRSLPSGTGFGCCWMVVCGASQKAVCDALFADKPQKYDYNEGVRLANKAASGENLLAVTAAHEKRIFVIGSAVSKFFFHTDAFLEKIKGFPCVYIYMTEHVSETHGFAQIKKGEIKRLFYYNEEEIGSIGAPLPEELALAYRLPGSIDDVRKKEENFTEVNEDMLVELAIWQTGICAEQYPYKKVSVGKLFLEETRGNQR